VLTIDRTAHADVAAPPERCAAVLADVESYPSWAGLISGVDVLAPDRVRLHAQVIGLPVHMDCSLELGPDRAVLRRLPYGDDDPESYVATWTVEPNGTGSAVELRVQAELDAPGPASMLRGRAEKKLADDLLEDFAKAVSAA
jgi:ribosome-associated toxin RatA of RatAB toxin-antitoxin module